jgi:hypothetical protein
MRALTLALALSLPLSSAALGQLPPSATFDPRQPLPEGVVIDAGVPSMPAVPTPANTVTIPPIDSEVIWNRLVDVMDDYFKISREQRVVFADGVPTEGVIETYPQTGATLLEPWRPDSVGFRERLECTLQSIRRKGLVRMQPDPAGWRIEAVVNKELENLPRPMRATTGGATFRNDDSLYRYGTPLPTLGQQVGDQPRPVASPARSAGWIPIGRDPLLERRILDKLLARLGVAPVPQAQPYYQPPAAGIQASPSSVPISSAPVAPLTLGPAIPVEALPPGAIIAPGPPVPVESLPLPR